MLSSARCFSSASARIPGSRVAAWQARHIGCPSWGVRSLMIVPKRVSTPRTRQSGYVFLAIPLITFGLGTWQVQRMMEKKELIQRVEERAHGDPKPLPHSVDECMDSEYQRVRAEGTFEHDKEMHIIPRPRKDASSSEYGREDESRSAYQHLSTPKKKRKILVMRGWVPWDRKDPSHRPEGQVQGKVVLDGLLRKGEKSTTFVPENKIDKNEWYWADLPTMAARTGADPILVDATAEMTPKGGYPVGGQTSIDIRDEHLQYIFTWYALSILTSVYSYNLIKKRWR